MLGISDRVLNVVGGGLAGAEAAWQAAEQGISVVLWEMRPAQSTPAHVSDSLAELVCSNSFGSDLPDRASGVLKAELRRLGSLIIQCADEMRVPAGAALAVDRELFARRVTERVEDHSRIILRREEVRGVPLGATVIATGPLTSSTLASDIGHLVGEDYLYFYDALAPIVLQDSIDMSVAFRASRYGKGAAIEGDYINCPMSKEEYSRFVAALLSAKHIELRDFEQEASCFFEGCLPVEEIASRGWDALAYGPMRPVGLVDPRNGRRPYAVVQLRQDNLAGTLYNLVGFQTNLLWSEQRRVFRLIPGLQDAQFVRFGQMHRNTFLNSPKILHSTMQYQGRDDLFLAGQIVGVEGYVASTGAGLLAGINAARFLMGKPLWVLPRVTMLGALIYYICHADAARFQPMKANFGIMPPLVPPVHKKHSRYRGYSERALAALERFLEKGLDFRSTGMPATTQAKAS